MINRQALLLVLAATAMNASAFVVPASSYTIQHTRQSTSVFSTIEDTQQAEKNLYFADVESAASLDETPKKLIMDIPPMPTQAAAAATAAAVNAPKAKKVAPLKKKKGNPHKEGVFSPIVVVAGSILGDDQLNKIRGKFIAMHSDIIKSFVDTSDSAFGQAVLTQLFEMVDTDNSGYLDKDEVAVALNLLGFKWLKEKHVAKIFERADGNGDMEISLEEFVAETPKTLRTNLVKLAKANGGDMGWLV